MRRALVFLSAGLGLVLLATGCGSGSTAPAPEGPVITSVSPASGTMNGGTTILITGERLANAGVGANDVLIGGNPAENVTVESSTQISCRTPQGAVGPAEITVTKAHGTDTLADGYTYYPPPTILSITPTEGSRFGGTAVEVKGTGFIANNVGETVCLIGLKELTDMVIVDDTTITGLTPSAWSEVPKDVTVRNRNGEATLHAGFTYTGPIPEIYQVSPAEGTRGGGTLLTILGDYFTLPGGELTVDLGNIGAFLVTRIDDQTLTCITPPGSAPGFVDVTVGNNNGTSTLPDAFYYIPRPIPSSISPDEGPIDGDTPVTITGVSLSGGGTTRVLFGATLATNVTVVNDTTITCNTPAATALGQVSVTVSNDNGEGDVPDGFTYVAPAFWWEQTFGTPSSSYAYSGFQSVSLPYGFPFFGTDYTTLYQVNGGHLDFGGSYNSSYSSSNALFAFPHISAFGQMHNQNASYNTYTTSHVSGRTIITYDRVPEYSAVGANSFQIHLHESGVFAILYQSLTGHAVTTYTSFVRIAVNPGGLSATTVDWSSGSHSSSATEALSQTFTGTTDLANSWLLFVPNASGGYTSYFSGSVPTDPHP